MTPESASGRRRYTSALRQERAGQTRARILAAAAGEFAARGWSGTTVARVADVAAVSPKTIEAIFGTKSNLLAAAVDWAIRGDPGHTPMPRRAAIVEMEAAPDAPSMLRLHAAHLRRVNRRSAGLAAAVEHAAHTDPTVSQLWRRMNKNRAYAVAWASSTLLSKPGRRHDLSEADARSGFWVTIDWATYRTLTQYAGLSAKRFEEWVVDFYTRQFLNERST